MVEKTFESAMQHHRAGQFERAEALYRQILAQEPDHADSLHLLGVVLSQRGQHAQAADLIRRAIALHPQMPHYYSNLGLVFTHSGQLSDAAACFRKVIALQPDNAVAFDHLGLLLHELGLFSESIQAASAAVRLRPEVGQYRLNLGTAYCKTNRQDLAIPEYREALRINPQNAVFAHNLGVALAENGQADEAIEALEKALALNPGVPLTHSAMGAVLLRVGRLEEAGKCLRRAIELAPNLAVAYNNLGGVLQEQGKWQEALEVFRKAVELDPANNASRWNYSRLLLMLGHWEQGWAEFDSRLNLPLLGLKRDFPQPQWDGSDPSGKTILLHAEGGHGDALNFIRFVPQVAQRGAKLILECQPGLITLFEGLPGLDRVIARGQPLPEFDWQIPLQGLPRPLGLTLENIPNTVPYLSAPADRVRRWAHRLASQTKLRVGLVWSGTRYVDRDIRTRTIDVFAPLAEVPGVKFFNLQTGEDSHQTPPKEMDWADFSAELTDFAETAALVQNLDLVVTIDTSVAHLAGALGKPVWVLIPFQCDFRWMLDRTDTPWYPTMRLFRQPTKSGWETPIRLMTEALRRFTR
jgi:Tfp pilus assembly protein PilF